MLRYWLRLGDMNYEFSEDDFSLMGYVEVPRRPAPYYSFDVDAWEWKMDPVKSRAAIAERRYQAEIAGITYGGHAYSTARADRTSLLEKSLMCVRDSTYRCDYKTQDGAFIEFGAQEFFAVSDAIDAYVNACFSREKILNYMVDIGTFNYLEIDANWPEQSR